MSRIAAKVSLLPTRIVTHERGRRRAAIDHVRPLLDLLAEDSQRRVYAGELEVRPPAAPTTGPHAEARGGWVTVGGPNHAEGRAGRNGASDTA
jgi:hypothetical protein